MNFRIKSISKTVFFLFVFHLGTCCAQIYFVNDQLHMHDKCEIKESNQIGVCKLWYDCPLVIKEFKETMKRPMICGYQEIIPIVCCPMTNVTVDYQLSSGNRGGAVESLNPVFTPELFQNYNYRHLCKINDNENGTVMYDKHCPEFQKLNAMGKSMKRLCNYDLCKDLVCCPTIQRPRLRQYCSYEHPELGLRLQTNYECRNIETGEEGFTTPYDECPYYSDWIKNGTALPRVCDWTFCNTTVCCPKQFLEGSACRAYGDYIFNTIEVVAGNCRMDDTGAPGICRPVKQCPTQYKLNKTQTICGYDCREQIICCPEPDFNHLTPGQRMCANARTYAYDYQKVIREFLPREVDKSRLATAISPSGGVVAAPKEFPHMATLGYRSDEPNAVTEWLCGGSLISERFVLTAGHCMSSKSSGFVKFVRLGIQNLVITENENIFETNTDCPEEFLVAERFPHPNYRAPSRYNDIALLKLDRDVKFNADIRPACLPHNSDIPKYLTAIGFGQTGFGAKRTEVLIKVELQFFNHTECFDAFKDTVNRKLTMGIVNQTQFCAGSRHGIQDTCPGDSGGPIQGRHSDYYSMATVHGVTSFGKACGFENSPAVYTRVYAFNEWIESVVWG